MIKTFLLQKIYISDKCCSSELSRKKKPETILLHCLQHDSNNNNNTYFWAANQNIRMISEGSCDWINDAENSALKSQE